MTWLYTEIKSHNPLLNTEIIKNKWGKDLNITFPQIRHINCQQVYEKMLNIINYWENANQDYNETWHHISDDLLEWLFLRKMVSIDKDEEKLRV